jgi:hypothetical protein
MATENFNKDNVPEPEGADIAMSDRELGALADQAKGAADRAALAIDDALAFVAASNKRIEQMDVASPTLS